MDDGKDVLRNLRPLSKDLWADGSWHGPKSLRAFLQMNLGFAALWQLVLTFIAFGGLFGPASIPGLYAIPLALIIGAAANLVVMLLFAHGLIADGE